MSETSEGKKTGPLPGDPSRAQRLEQIIRVNHAGEYGAVRIYAGQLAVLGRTSKAPVLEHMAEQEHKHLEAFDQLIADRRVRPTALLPFWHLAGFALGAGTALLGERAAMACTVAIEEVIDEHYADQIDELGDDEPELTETFAKFRDEELEHREIGIEHGAERTPGFGVLTGLIKAGSRLAIRLSERI